MIRSDTLTPIPVSTLQAGGIHLAYHEMGEGEPLLLIMGLGGSMHEWDRVFLSRMAQNYRVIIFDNRGAGDSGGAHLGLTIPDMTIDCCDLLRALGISKAHLLGYSMGAMIALDMVAKHPEMTGRIILLGPVTDGAGASARIQPFIDTSLPELIRVEALLPGTFIAEHSDLRDVFPPPVHPVNIPLIYRQLRAIEEYTISHEILASLKRKTLILVGSGDLITPAESAQTIAGLIPHAEIRIIPGGGHGMIYQIPEILADMTIEFLERGNT
jgi:pimeloyl-ACP methyl ester carboxylesterase